MVEPVISLDGLRKRFGRTIAVDGISMVIGESEIFGFLGANGAGKITTIRMPCGLTRPTRGHGAIHGLDIWRNRSRVRSNFGYVPQRFSLYADLTVLENLRFFGSAYRVPRDRLRARIETLLSELALAASRDTEAGRLSGGFKQVLSISCALIHEPSALFLDEPTTGLDPVHRQYIWVEPKMEDVFMAYSQSYFANTGLGKQKSTGECWRARPGVTNQTKDATGVMDADWRNLFKPSVEPGIGWGRQK